jgi:hypothetical protein
MQPGFQLETFASYLEIDRQHDPDCFRRASDKSEKRRKTLGMSHLVVIV